MLASGSDSQRTSGEVRRKFGRRVSPCRSEMRAQVVLHKVARAGANLADLRARSRRQPDGSGMAALVAQQIRGLAVDWVTSTKVPSPRLRYKRVPELR